MNRLEEVERGEKARVLHDQIKERFEQVRQNIHNLWSQTTARDMEGREILYHKLHALDEVERSICEEIDTGKMAAKQIEVENATN